MHLDARSALPTTRRRRSATPRAQRHYAAPSSITWRPLAFASSFGDHAVLQQAPAQAVVWGFAPAALGVTLTLAGGGLSSKLYGRLQPFNATAYTWRVSLPPIAADHKPYSITIEQAGAPSATLRDVLFGEVWVCSGQSNMAFLVENAFGGADLQDANNHPEIRSRRAS